MALLNPGHKGSPRVMSPETDSAAAALQKFNTQRQEYQALSEKLAELEMDAEEHRVVMEALRPLEPSRTCHRLVGGVLVERTVGQVLPALETNLSGIQQLIKGLSETLAQKEGELVRLEQELKSPTS